jgi:hypothetical protein
MLPIIVWPWQSPTGWQTSLGGKDDRLFFNSRQSSERCCSLACHPAFYTFRLTLPGFRWRVFSEARPEAEVTLSGDFLEWSLSATESVSRAVLHSPSGRISFLWVAMSYLSG